MRVGDYELGRKLGEGAFGATHVATKIESGETVVVKQLSVKGLPDWKPFDRFEREAKVLRSLEHPGVVGFVDAFADGDDYYIVSELIEGETLGQKIDGGARWSEEMATELLRHLLETLAYLHGLSPRVVHRDIKPGNVVIRPDGRPVLVDFGAALDLAARRADGGLTVAGTAGYMPPEQAMGNAGPRSDLFGLGATMLHALSHTHPSELLDGLRLQIPDDVAVSPKLRRILERLIEPNPSDRFESADAALAALSAEEAAPPRAVAKREPTELAVTADAFVALAPAARPLPAGTRALLHARSVRANGPLLLLPILGILLSIGMFRLGGLVVGLTVAVVGMVWPIAHLFKRRAGAILAYQNGPAAKGHVLEAEVGEVETLVTYRVRHQGVAIDGRLRIQTGKAPTPEAGDAVVAFFDSAKPQHHIAMLEAELPSPKNRSS